VVPDNDPNASPSGIAIRFHLAEHLHTEIVAHSVDGFPARTAEEFVEFLGAHPSAPEFVQAPKPFAVSFASESFFSVSAYRFTDESGAVRALPHTSRVRGEYLEDGQLRRKGPTIFLTSCARE
jgi:catalase